MKYMATYAAPKSEGGLKGTFEFESQARAGTRRNATDARVAMLEEFGSAALSWSVAKVERAKGQPAGT